MRLMVVTNASASAAFLIMSHKLQLHQLLPDMKEPAYHAPSVE